MIRWLLGLIATAQCEHCRDGLSRRYRPETREWIHEVRTPMLTGKYDFVYSITLCRANAFLNHWFVKRYL